MDEVSKQGLFINLGVVFVDSIEEGQLLLGEAEEFGTLGVGVHLLFHLHDGPHHGGGVDDPFVIAVEGVLQQLLEGLGLGEVSGGLFSNLVIHEPGEELEPQVFTGLVLEGL